LTAGKWTCVGLILFAIGNEWWRAEARQILEIVAALVTARGLLF
jgi:hypothetical protein